MEVYMAFRHHCRLASPASSAAVSAGQWRYLLMPWAPSSSPALRLNRPSAWPVVSEIHNGVSHCETLAVACPVTRHSRA